MYVPSIFLMLLTGVLHVAYRGSPGLKDTAQLVEHRERVLRLLEEERARLPGGDPKRIILGGFKGTMKFV